MYGANGVAWTVPYFEKIALGAKCRLNWRRISMEARRPTGRLLWWSVRGEKGWGERMELLFWCLSQHWKLPMGAQETVKLYIICAALESREVQRAV